MHHLLSRYLDISSVPRRSFFELLACFSRHELEREKLLEFISAQGQEEMHAYCSRPRRTILEVWVGSCAILCGGAMSTHRLCSQAQMG